MRAVRGTASYSEQGGDWKPLSVGKSLQPGSSVKTGVASQVDLFLEPVENGVRISMELESSEMIKRFVMAGLGIGFMATTNAREEIKSRHLKDIPLAPLPMMRTLGLIYRRDKPLSRAALGFIEVILDFAKQVNARSPAEAASQRAAD